MTQPNTSQHPASVDAYIRHGWSLVPIPPGSKGPRTVGWNQREAALRSQTDLPAGHGIGLAHAYSGTMALDIDDWDTAAPMLALCGVDLQALYDAADAVIVDSGRPGHGKLLYAMPFGLALASKRVQLEQKTVYELRCATADGLTVQDVLPPTIHPDTQQPYRWAGRGHWTRLPTIPMALLDMWHSLIRQDEAPAPSAAPISASWEEIRSALEAIPADCSREDWITCGMAIHHAASTDGALDEGFRVWNDWSATSQEKYPGERAVVSQWRSFRSDKSTAVRLGSLFHLARENGWERPVPDATHLFGPAVRPEEILASLKIPIPRLSTEWCPPVLAQRVADVAEQIGVDPVIPLLAGLGAVCGALDARSRLELMDGYEVPPILWCMVVGDPGAKKTPGGSPMWEILRTLEFEDVAPAAARLLEWEGREAYFAACKKEFLTAAASGAMGLGEQMPFVPDLPPQPRPLKIVVSDITSQRLVRDAADHPRGQLCTLDEMSGWIKKLTATNGTEDRGTWVQAYEGHAYAYDRVGGGCIRAECLAVAMTANIQPDYFREHISTLAQDGTLQRFIVGVVDRKLIRRGEPQPHHKISARAWEQAIRLIYALPATTYTLSDDAFRVFREFQLWFERTKQDHALLGEEMAFQTAFSKLEGTAARLALVFHVLDEPFSSIVSKNTMDRAITMVRNFVVPSLQYALCEVAGIESMEGWLMNWLLYHLDGKVRVTLSDVKRGARRRLVNKTIWEQDRIVIGAMAMFEEARWVIRVDDGSEEHLHRATWDVNPALVTQFAGDRLEVILARQRAEDERRRIAQIERKFVKGFDPLTMEHLLRATG